MPSLQELLHERDQLLDFWRGIDPEMLRRRAIAVLIQRVNHAPNRDQGHHIRQFHNALGYRAGGTLAQGGLCAGCLYRTAAFIKLPQARRTGSKRHPEHLAKVHLEHTIPVSALTAELAGFAASDLDPAALTEYLLARSITTAMLEKQGKIHHPLANPEGMVLPGNASGNQALVPEHRHWNRPFMRYTGGPEKPRIFNVLTAEEIDVEAFTMQDFDRDLRALLEEAGGAIRLPRRR